MLLASMGLIFSLAHRPIANRYIRIDEMGRAQAIAYSDLNYSPREGEVRTYLTDWANYRYTINRETIGMKYPLNYYFLSQNLASQLMTDDNQNHLVSQVMGGQIEQSDVEVKNVTITSMSQETVQGRNNRPRNGACGHRQALLAAQLSRAAQRALGAQCHLLPEPQTGQRPGQDLPAVRDHQSARIDHHGVPREPHLCRPDRAWNTRSTPGIAAAPNGRRSAMSFQLILPFFPEELRGLLLDPSISDLMINGATGVYADRDGIVQHIPLKSTYTNERLQAAIERVARILGQDLTARIPY